MNQALAALTIALFGTASFISALFAESYSVKNKQEKTSEEQCVHPSTGFLVSLCVALTCLTVSHITAAVANNPWKSHHWGITELALTVLSCLYHLGAIGCYAASILKESQAMVEGSLIVAGLLSLMAATFNILSMNIWKIPDDYDENDDYQVLSALPF